MSNNRSSVPAPESVEGRAISQWYTEAAAACAPFIFPESRFRMRWVHDDLDGPLEDAQSWLDDHPCPDEAIGAHLRAVLAAYAEMPGASVPRMMALRESIEKHASAIDRRQTPRA